MIPYEELVAALQGWRSRQGLPTATTDYLGDPAATDYSIMDTAVAAEAIEEISDFDVAEEVEVAGEPAVGGYDDPAYGDDQPYEGSHQGYDDDQGYDAGEPVEYQPADIDAMRAEYASDAFGEEQETAYSPVQSDAEVEEQVLDYSADYDDEGGATVIGGEVGGEAPAVEDGGYGMDAPESADDLDMESFVPLEPAAADPDGDHGEAGYDDGALGADPAAADDALPAYGAGADYREGTVDVDLDLAADDVIEAALPPPPPTSGSIDFGGDDDESTSIAASSEPPPLAPPPEEESSASVEIDALDVIDEDDDPGRGTY
jgi:hypothetical protein